MTRETEHWSLDRRIPVALIIAMIGHVLIFGWFASKFDSRLSHLENSDKDQSIIIATITAAQQQTNISLAEIKKDQGYAVETLKEIKTKLTDKNGE